MIAIAITTGVQTLKYHRQPGREGGDGGNELQKKTGRINLNFQPGVDHGLWRVLLCVVVGGLAGDDDVVDVALSKAGVGDADEVGVGV
jgi:hypothetical protein